FAADAEAIDHRTVGFGTARGRDAVLRAAGALMQLTDDFAVRTDDVVALRSDALLVCRTTSGTLRATGGEFERNLLMLWCFGVDGLLPRWEQFDAEREDAALARFDALTAAPPEPQRRAVRPNAATAVGARIDAAIAARDEATLADL